MNISELVGKTLISAQVNSDNDRIEFKDIEGGEYVMYHSQDCCENVSIESIDGDLNDLIGTPITQAEERTSNENQRNHYDDSFTWTFYSFATVKGYVTIRWYGTSNGYYSESVDFQKLK